MVRLPVIVSAVRQQNNDSLLLNRDVYNGRMRVRDEAFDGREPLIPLLGDLQHKNVMHDVAMGERGRVAHLFFAFPASVQLARENYQVVLLDSTYKTSRFKMPLLHFVDMTATNMIFSIGFCFTQAGREVGYIWAATRAKWCFDQARQPKVLITDREFALTSALELTFPSAATILCVRYIQKNVLSNVKQHFSRGSEFERFMGCWRDLISSKTVAEFETSWSSMQMEFCAPVVGYLASTWFPHKEKFVEAWTRHVVHFGHVGTSRVEGCHAFVKKWVSTSTGDINDVVNRIHLALEN